MLTEQLEHAANVHAKDLEEGKHRFAPEAPLFPGRHPHQPLSTRMAERIVKRCARRARLPRHVTSMTLRHTHAVQALEDGVNIRELQVRLGHASVATTLLYQQCLLPKDAVSPLDTLEKTAETRNAKPETRNKHEARKTESPKHPEWFRRALESLRRGRISNIEY